MKKRLLLKLGLVALLGAGLFWAWLWWTEPTSGVNRATAGRIRNGMTEAEVVALVGVEAKGDGIIVDKFSMDDLTDHTAKFSQLREVKTESIWNGENGVLLVYFDNDDKVVLSRFLMYRERGPFIDKLRRWLHID